MTAEGTYPRLRVLIVDDDTVIRQVIRALLLQLGVRQVFEATDGVAGLLEVLRVRPDLVLCDVRMKPLGGLEFLKQLRTVKLTEIAQTAVVMLTSDATHETVLAARQWSADGYLVKPVSSGQLRARIEAALAANAPRTEAILDRVLM